MKLASVKTLTSAAAYVNLICANETWQIPAEVRDVIKESLDFVLQIAAARETISEDYALNTIAEMVRQRESFGYNDAPLALHRWQQQIKAYYDLAIAGVQAMQSPAPLPAEAYLVARMQSENATPDIAGATFSLEEAHRLFSAHVQFKLCQLSKQTDAAHAEISENPDKGAEISECWDLISATTAQLPFPEVVECYQRRAAEGESKDQPYYLIIKICLYQGKDFGDGIFTE